MHLKQSRSTKRITKDGEEGGGNLRVIDVTSALRICRDTFAASLALLNIKAAFKEINTHLHHSGRLDTEIAKHCQCPLTARRRTVKIPNATPSYRVQQP